MLPRRFLLPHFLKLVQNETEGDEAEDGSLPVKRVAVDSPQNFEVNALLNDLNDPSGFEEPKSMFQNNEAMEEEAEYTAASNRLLKEMNEKLDDLTKKISEFQITAERTRQESNSCKEDKLQAEILPENYIMHTCRSFEDIIKDFREFRYEEEGQTFVSSVCLPSNQTFLEASAGSSKLAVFKFNRTASKCAFLDDVSPSILTKKFRNLKSHLIAHLRSQTHKQF